MAKPQTLPLAQLTLVEKEKNGEKKVYNRFLSKNIYRNQISFLSSVLRGIMSQLGFSMLQLKHNQKKLGGNDFCLLTLQLRRVRAGAGAFPEAAADAKARELQAHTLLPGLLPRAGSVGCLIA